MSTSGDRALLFGLLALRTGLIGRDELIDAFRAWAADKGRPIGDRLVALGRLDEAGRGVIESLVDIHAAADGGDAAKTLAAIAIDGETLARLSTLTDADPDATLDRVDRGATRGDATRSFHGRDATGAVDDLASDGVAGDPRFRVLRPHARGALGVVDVALDSELDREVALKRIHDDRADDPDSRSRFQLEARITGGLEHPGIVPVYGLGRNEDGRPYYAMRLVRGDSLRDAIKSFHEGPKSRLDRSLAFRRLLKNFTDVCNAVEYAHSRGVLHRDLKPANVIVGKHGETLVVDWGTAKVLGTSPADSAETTLAPTLADDGSTTLPGQAMGTPAYMSPEQARGDLEALGPRSDVYSLGATLYHLLTGEAPFRGTLKEVLNAVELGGVRSPRVIDPAIDPALEAIVLKAMATDPEGRYPSAKALADDVDRWLADERVAAYAEPRARGLVRWLTRHRAGVTGLAAAGLAAFVGLAAVSAVQTGSRRALDAKNAELSRANVRLAEGNGMLAESNHALALQRKRAEENESQAIDAVKRFKDAIVENPGLKNDPKLESLRKTLLEEPLSYLGRLRDRLQAEDDARPEFLLKLANVADEHAVLDHEIGNRRDAVRSIRLALDVLGRLVRDHPDAVEYRARLAECEYHLSYMDYGVGDDEGSLAAHRREVAIYEGLVRDRPDVPGFRSGLAWGCNGLGSQLRVMGRSDEARPNFERAVEILEALARDDPENLGERDRLAMCLDNLADAIFKSGRRDEGLAIYRRAVEILERLVPERGASAANLAWTCNELAERLRIVGREAEARKLGERSAEVYERLVRDNPSNTVFLECLWPLLESRGDAFRGRGRNEEARAAFGRAVEIGERLTLVHPGDAAAADKLATSLADLSYALCEAGLFDEAVTASRRSVDVNRRAVDAAPEAVPPRVALGRSRNAYGYALREAGRLDESVKVHGLAAEAQEGLVRDHPEVVAYQEQLRMSLANRAIALRIAGRIEEARTDFERVMEMDARLIRERPDAPVYNTRLIGLLDVMGKLDLQATGYAGARERLLKTIAAQRKTLERDPRDPFALAVLENQLFRLVQAERGLGHRDEAARVDRELGGFRFGDPRQAGVNARLKAVIAGEPPGDGAERLALAQRAYDVRRFPVAFKLWEQALASDPALADDRGSWARCNTARAAAQAADGWGIDPPDDPAERIRLRGRALDWLKTEMEVLTKRVESGRPGDGDEVARTLRYWGVDPELAAVRDPDSLDKLPEEERTAWKTFWNDVAKLLRRAG